ncbi:MAG: DUF1178 family protein [Rhodospirillales bacterium]
MIVFELVCAGGHRFEGWFRDGAAFDAQNAAGDVSCPYCADVRVNKAPMAPHVVRSGSKTDRGAGHADEPSRELLEMMDRLRRHVEATCQYVGGDFAAEARRMHYGETEPKSVYGEATAAESTALEEEGIDVVRVPWLVRRDG